MPKEKGEKKSKKALCKETTRLDGKLIIVTGANTGIGKETAAELARRGATVVMACRNLEKAEEARKDILATYGENSPVALTKNVPDEKVKEILTPVKEDQLIIEKLDLSSFQSIRDFVQRVIDKNWTIDVLINNAGIYAGPYAKTADGFEQQIGVNHLGPFLLTELLIPRMSRDVDGSRVIFLSSVAHKMCKMQMLPFNIEEKKYSKLQCYCRSKLANAMYAHYLSDILGPDGVKTASVHPGVVQTEIFRNSKFGKMLVNFLAKPFTKNSWEGAQTTLYTVLTPNLTSGAYYEDCAKSKGTDAVYDKKAQKDLIDASRKAVGLD